MSAGPLQDTYLVEAVVVNRGIQELQRLLLSSVQWQVPLDAGGRLVRIPVYVFG